MSERFGDDCGKAFCERRHNAKIGLSKALLLCVARDSSTKTNAVIKAQVGNKRTKLCLVSFVSLATNIQSYIPFS